MPQELLEVRMLFQAVCLSLEIDAVRMLWIILRTYLKEKNFFEI